MGDVPDAAALRRRRRAAHAARHLRFARCACAAPAAPRCASTTDASPTFCFASATIGNPGELASALCGLPVEAIADDASPRADTRAGVLATPAARRALRCARFGERRNRSVAHPVRARGSSNARVHAQPARCRGRSATRAAGGSPTPHPSSRTGSPRTAVGTSPRNAASSNAGSPSGRLLGIAATNALELGIDVGGLDAVILNGFPGTLASMWQQAGRAGRTGRRSAAVLVAGDDQLDQWYAAHPTELTTARAGTRRRESAESIRAARAGRLRGARAATRPRRRALVRSRHRRSSARAGARRSTHPARRQDVLVGSTSTGARRRTAFADRRSNTA